MGRTRQNAPSGGSGGAHTVIDKGDLAIVIAAISAAFAGSSVMYARRMAKNDSLRMKRKPIVWELGDPSRSNCGRWTLHYLIVRNFEPVGARITGAKAKPRRGILLLQQRAQNQRDEYGNASGFDDTEAARQISFEHPIQPFGSVTSLQGRGPVQTIGLFTKGISKASDLELKWEWADGTPN